MFVFGPVGPLGPVMSADKHCGPAVGADETRLGSGSGGIMGMRPWRTGASPTRKLPAWSGAPRNRTRPSCAGPWAGISRRSPTRTITRSCPIRRGAHARLRRIGRAFGGAGMSLQNRRVGAEAGADLRLGRRGGAGGGRTATGRGRRPAGAGSVAARHPGLPPRRLRVAVGASACRSARERHRLGTSGCNRPRLTRRPRPVSAPAPTIAAFTRAPVAVESRPHGPAPLRARRPSSRAPRRGGSQRPVKLGRRFSSMEFTASLWSSVLWARAW